jgi:hypothetical protein
MTVLLASAVIKWRMLMWNNGNTSQGPPHNVAVKSWKSGEGIICVTSREEGLRCWWSLCVLERGQRATEMLPQVLTTYRTASKFTNLSVWAFDLPCLVLTNQDVTMWPVCWCHHCTDHSQLLVSPLHRSLSAVGVTTAMPLHRSLSAVGVTTAVPLHSSLPAVGVTTPMPLHRSLSAQSHSVIHSTFVPCNSTAHVLFPATVLQLTQIPPSSTDCLQIWRPTNTNHLYGTSLTCNCSVYCTLPRSVYILLQINIHEQLHYWYFISSWKQIGILHWHWIPMFVMVLPGPIIPNIQNPPYLTSSHDNFLSNSLTSLRHSTRCNRVVYIIIKIMNTQNCFVSHDTQSQTALKSARNMQWQNLNWWGGW